MAGAAEDHVAQFYEDALRASYERDRELGMTSTGPHRDDILMRLDGKDLRTYGSQGQHRTAVFSLRMAEAKYVEEKSGEIPILLMDDVFSQLDTERGGRLMDLVRGVYQTMITAPREEHARYPLEGLARMDVKNGEIRIADGP
jgi:DNA replication and repair protein RecF